MNRLLGHDTENQLRVLLYHDIAPAEMELFEKQLRWLSRRWKFVSPAIFEEMMSGERPIVGRNVLLTFDDGFLSNKLVAEKILAPMGIKAIFFVIADFPDISGTFKAHQFIANNIVPGTEPYAYPEHMVNMGWSDVEYLIKHGHTIGSHTRTHARLSLINEWDALSQEIVSSAEKLETRLGIEVHHFAYTFGNIGSISEVALRMAQQKYKFVHSGVRGMNTPVVHCGAIRRDSIDPKDSCFMVGAFLEGSVDSRYAKARIMLNDWSRNSADHVI